MIRFAIRTRKVSEYNLHDVDSLVRYDNATQQLTTGDGLCVTAASPAPPTPVKEATMVLGRPLADKGFAVLFLNNMNASHVMTCDVGCMTKMGVPSSEAAGAKYTVMDVISHEEVMTVNAGEALTTKVAVPADGGSVYYRLSPSAM